MRERERGGGGEVGRSKQKPGQLRGRWRLAVWGVWYDPYGCVGCSTVRHATTDIGL